MAVRGPLTGVGDGHSQRQDSRSGSSGRANELGRANLRSAGPVTLTAPGAGSARRIARGARVFHFRLVAKPGNTPGFGGEDPFPEGSEGTGPFGGRPGVRLRLRFQRGPSPGAVP